METQAAVEVVLRGLENLLYCFNFNTKKLSVKIFLWINKQRLTKDIKYYKVGAMRWGPKVRIGAT